MADTLLGLGRRVRMSRVQPPFLAHGASSLFECLPVVGFGALGHGSEQSKIRLTFLCKGSGWGVAAATVRPERRLATGYPVASVGVPWRPFEKSFMSHS